VGCAKRQLLGSRTPAVLTLCCVLGSVCDGVLCIETDWEGACIRLYL
jgi:hypothetical protein